jgi:hypothetical protein
MIPNCYFCNKPLEKFRDPDETDNYTNHYSCYNCPDVEHGVELPIWKRNCSVIIDDQHVSVIYLYLPNINIWLSVFNWKERAFTDVKDERGQFILRVKTAPDVFNISLDILENKIKTWILFS